MTCQSIRVKKDKRRKVRSKRNKREPVINPVENVVENESCDEMEGEENTSQDSDVVKSIPKIGQRVSFPQKEPYKWQTVTFHNCYCM